MARGRKSSDNKEEGVLRLIEYEPKIMEDKNAPNILIDNYVGVSIDKDGNWELFQVKQTTVSEDNIKSTTNVYEDKYKIGDTYQEWVSMGKYLGSYESAVEYYSNLKFNNEVSKLKYCIDIKELVKIRKDIHDGLNNFMIKNTIPEVAKQINNVTKDVYEISNKVKELKPIINEAELESNKTIELAKEKRKIIVQEMPKEKKHRLKLEEN